MARGSHRHSSGGACPVSEVAHTLGDVGTAHERGAGPCCRGSNVWEGPSSPPSCCSRSRGSSWGWARFSPRRRSWGPSPRRARSGVRCGASCSRAAGRRSTSFPCSSPSPSPWGWQRCSAAGAASRHLWPTSPSTTWSVPSSPSSWALTCRRAWSRLPASGRSTRASSVRSRCRASPWRCTTASLT
jgi:hypothetical protein